MTKREKQWYIYSLLSGIGYGLFPRFCGSAFFEDLLKELNNPKPSIFATHKLNLSEKKLRNLLNCDLFNIDNRTNRVFARFI